jgi:hypothetical protein
MQIKNGSHTEVKSLDQIHDPGVINVIYNLDQSDFKFQCRQLNPMASQAEGSYIHSVLHNQNITKVFFMVLCVCSNSHSVYIFNLITSSKDAVKAV